MLSVTAAAAEGPSNRDTLAKVVGLWSKRALFPPATITRLEAAAGILPPPLIGSRWG